MNYYRIEKSRFFIKSSYLLHLESSSYGTRDIANFNRITRGTAMSLTVAEKDYLWDFRELVSGKTGLRIREQDTDNLRKVVEKRIRIHRLQSVEEYIYFLESGTTESRREHTDLIALLTVGESYFFRDKGQCSLLKERVLPELIERNKEKRRLRIWSAGCSTGEEPYSLAILADELLPSGRGWEIGCCFKKHRV